jgi:hypothetical protein
MPIFKPIGQVQVWERISAATYRTLDLRLSRQDIEALDSETTNFSIQLARMDGSFSASVQVRNYTVLRGPVGGPEGL